VKLIIVQKTSLKNMRKKPLEYGEKEANTNENKISESMTLTSD